MIEKIFDKVSKLACLVSILSLLGCVGVNGYEIAGRIAFGKSNYWIQDATSFFMVWFVFFGMITITWEKKDIYIELLVDALPTSIAHAVKLLVNALASAFSFFLAYKIIQYMQLNVGKYMTTAPIPANLNTVAMLLCMIFFGLFSTYDCVRLLMKRERMGNRGEELP